MTRILILLMFVTATGAGCSSAPRAKSEPQAYAATAKFEGTSDFVGASKVHRYKLANGLKVLILEDHRSPTFAYHVWYDVGSKDEQRGLTGLAHLFEHMMFKETKNLKEGEFDRLLESAGAEGENAFTSRDYTGYIQSLPKDQLDLITRLEAERMANLIVNEKALDTEREVVQNERRFRKENSPDGQLYEKLFQLAYTKHSYQWPVIGYEADLEAASRQACESFYKRFYAPNNATVVIVGDVDPKDAIEKIEKYYGPIPPSNIDRKVSPKEPAQTAERRETLPLKIQVQKLMMAYHTVDIKNPDVIPLEVLRNVLANGKSSRLYRKLVDAGIATEADIENSEQRYPGMFIFFVNMQKGKTAEQAISVIEKEIREIIAGRVSKEELDRAKAMHLFSTYDGLASHYRKAQFLGFYETVAGRYERGLEMLNGLKTVSAADLSRVAKKYLRQEVRNIVIGVPAEKK